MRTGLSAWKISVIVSAMIFSGCTALVGRHQTEWPESVRAHLSKPIGSIFPELEYYGVYTYVLTGSGANDEESFGRYQALSEAVQSQSSHGDMELVQSHRERFSQFLIPCKLGPSSPQGSLAPQELSLLQGSPSRKVYCGPKELDPELSKRILGMAMLLVEDENLADRLGSNPGPFLVSTVRPLSEYDPGEIDQILYADLSLTHPDAMAEVVAAYKQEINKHEGGAGKLVSFKVLVLSAVLSVSGYIDLIQSEIK